jgi:hypothetical protein
MAFGSIGKKIESLFGKVDAVFALAAGLAKDMGDIKATIAVIERDIADGKAVLAEVKGITGHTATAVTVATTASPAMPLLPLVAEPATAGAPAASLASRLGGIVGDVSKGIESVIPGQAGK